LQRSGVLQVKVDSYSMAVPVLQNITCAVALESGHHVAPRRNPSWEYNTITASASRADEQGKKDAQEMAAKLRTNGKVARQVILLTALYARTDQATLLKVRKLLQPWTWLADAMPSQLSAPSAMLSVGALALTAVAGTAAADAWSQKQDRAGGGRPPARGESQRSSAVTGAVASVTEKPWAWGAGLLGLCAGSCGLYMRARHARSLQRAVKLQANVRVVKRRPVDDVASVLDLTVKGNDDVETIRCALARARRAACVACVTAATTPCASAGSYTQDGCVRQMVHLCVHLRGVGACSLAAYRFRRRSRCRSQAVVQGDADRREREPEAREAAQHRAHDGLPGAARLWRLLR
jgi:hypothetical protein